MKDLVDLVKLVGGAGKSTIGTVTRAWVTVWGGIAAYIYLFVLEAHPAGVNAIAPVPAALVAGFMISLPVMAVLAIVYVMRKW